MANLNPTPTNDPDPEPRRRLHGLHYLKTIYLFPKEVINISQHVAMKFTYVNGAPTVLLCIAACLGLTMALYRLVERPCIYLRDKIFHRMIKHKSQGKSPGYKTTTS